MGPQERTLQDLPSGVSVFKPWKPAQPAKLQPFKPAQLAKIVMLHRNFNLPRRQKLIFRDSPESQHKCDIVL